MAKRVQRYRATSAAMALITGPVGELIVNLTRNSLHVHDGVTPGGHELGRADGSNIVEVSGANSGLMTPALLAELAQATIDVDALEARMLTAENDIDSLELRMTAAEAAITALESNAAGNLKAPSGTRMVFQQTAAPSGWTKETNSAFNNVALRLVTGTVGSGGANSFTTVFGSKSTASDGAHTHNSGTLTTDNSGVAGSITGPSGVSFSGNHNHNISGSTGSAGAHTHTVPNMNLSYRDVIIAAKAA